LRKGLEGAARGGNRLVDVGLGTERNLVHRFFGGRIDHRRGLLDGGIDPGAIDVELHAVDHGEPLDWALRSGDVQELGKPRSLRQASLHESAGRRTRHAQVLQCS
jgi:hypothetical protein